ncbi:MAG: hypothetical protein ACUVQG_01470 [Thermogutta sp.]
MCTVTIFAVLCFQTLLAGAQSPWVETRAIRGLTIYSQFPLNEVEDIQRDLEYLAEDIESSLRIQVGARPVIVLLFQGRREYDNFVKQEFTDVPYRRALYVERAGRALVLAYRSRELATDLRHECTHALLHSALPMVPLWLDEGLAEYFEIPRDQRPFSHPHLKTVRLWANLGYVPSLSKLEAVPRMDAMDAAKYRWSWAWVHFMLHGPPAAQAELVAYLQTLAQYGVPEPLSERLAKRLGDPRRAYLDHFKRWAR